MARGLNRLTPLAANKLKDPGRYADGGGLYLQVARGGSRSWLFRFMLDGKAREMGLGSCADVSLADARKRAAECRLKLEAGQDPIASRDATKAAAEVVKKVEEAKRQTFDQCAAAYIEAHEKGWKNPKLAVLWRSTLRTYASPAFGALPVGEVDTGLVMQVLEPLWTTKNETASRVRMRVENILDWAKVRGYRQGENPARWKGHLDHLLPERGKVAKVKHHAALPFDEVAAFMVDLRGRDALAARALELVILTAARTSEVLEAVWDEIDFEAKIWSIPAARMKMDRDHRIPLSEPAVDLLRGLADVRSGPFVFPGQKVRNQAAAPKPLSNMSMLMLLKRISRDDITAHGFRSTFRDWAAETTGFPNHVLELCLAHAIGNEAEAAYRRGDMLEKRREVMTAWATHCATVPVVV